MTTPSAASGAWTCPFCPLACDHLGVSTAADGGLMLQGSNCERAARGLAACASASAAPCIDGQPASLDAAIAAAAERLGASRQPLFAGLGSDVAGARALYPLACATGAIVDSAGSDALMHGLRAMQDRGQFTTTLAEVRTRADLIVFVGGLPTSVAPLIGERLGIGDAQVAQRHVVVIGPEAGDEAVLAAWAGAGVSTEAIPLHGDLFDTVALLDALVARRPAVANLAVPAALRALADRLHAARYGVLVGAPPRLPAQGALLIEAVHRIVGELNRKTRAAALWIGGGNGVATANQVFAWLSGVPMRSRAGPRGLEHEPLRFGTTRLLAQGAVDALLWVASFDAESAPPGTPLPTIVLGHPALASRCNKPGTVFIPVTTPGIGSAGHVFRTDGTVLMPLHAVRKDSLPTVAEVAKRLLQALPQRSAA
ncbi:formylmethanofuran dehydrogenase [Variovorax sp. YR752]|uniref:formylmethanofuran dehydrogenase n=1 Tax=Variovorax sp. YR752 TaxID=1884383 RepID=UPI003137C3C1